MFVIVFLTLTTITNIYLISLQYVGIMRRDPLISATAIFYTFVFFSSLIRVKVKDHTRKM